MKLISIVVPFLNEEKTLSKVVQTLLDLDFSEIGYHKELLLINDGSTDQSSHVIWKFLHSSYDDTHIIYHDNGKNKGKGYSVKKWFELSSWDLMIIQDADMEYNPQDMIPLIKKIEQWYDVIYGSRIRWLIQYGNSYSHLPFLLGGLFVSFLTTLLSWKVVTDEPTCYKLYTKKCKSDLLKPQENGFEREPAATMIVLMKGLKYGEVPIHYKARKSHQWKKIKLIDGWKAIVTLFTYRFFR